MPFQIWKAPPDGSCFFHSVGHLLGIPASQLRLSCVHYIAAHHETRFSDLKLSEWIFFETGMSVAAYIKHMKYGTHWGGLVEARCLSELYQCEINIYLRKDLSFQSPTFQAHRIAKIEPNTICSKRVLHLLYSNEVHYDALVPELRQH